MLVPEITRKPFLIPKADSFINIFGTIDPSTCQPSPPPPDISLEASLLVVQFHCLVTVHTEWRSDS